MDQSIQHLPVLLKETISQLCTDPDGIYLDGTIGFGGHAAEILKKLTPNGKLIGIDLDPYALEYTQNYLSTSQVSYSLHQANFGEYPNLLQKLGIKKLAGILLDLGFSSSQINAGHRGFSFQYNAPLDMRYNPAAGISARDYLNKTNIHEIEDIIKHYGEEKYYRKISFAIVEAVKKGKMNSTFDLRDAVKKSVNQRFLTKSLARVFQAVRIKVNNEMDALHQALIESINWLKLGGRIGIISFHSIEDRIVKHFFINCAKSCICPREFPVCTCDKIPTLKILTRKAILPHKIEIKQNPRSRSAKLRVAERI